jgi:hypothetical protein
MSGQAITTMAREFCVSEIGYSIPEYEALLGKLRHGDVIYKLNDFSYIAAEVVVDDSIYVDQPSRRYTVPMENQILSGYNIIPLTVTQRLKNATTFYADVLESLPYHVYGMHVDKHDSRLQNIFKQPSDMLTSARFVFAWESTVDGEAEYDIDEDNSECDRYEPDCFLNSAFTRLVVTYKDETRHFSVPYLRQQYVEKVFASL